MKGVYTIILMDTSPRIFAEFPNKYVHTFHQESDTGLSIDLLQNYIFIPLDIFREKYKIKVLRTNWTPGLHF